MVRLWVLLKGSTFSTRIYENSGLRDALVAPDIDSLDERFLSLLSCSSIRIHQKQKSGEKQYPMESHKGTAFEGDFSQKLKPPPL